MSPDSSEPTRELLSRYLAGEATPDETAAVRRATGQSVPVVDVEAALTRVKSRLQAPDGPSVLPLASSRPRVLASSNRDMFRIAALVALVVGSGLVWRLTRGTTPSVTHTASWSTAAGALDSIPLPDGSKVILGGGSRLTMLEGYGGAARIVSLDGEAYFDVVHRDASPFTVQAAGVEIRDVGTTFSVKTDGEGARVAVLTGSVAVLDTARRVVATLKAGEVAEVKRSQKPVVSAGASSETDLGFTRGRLVFEDAPIARVQAELKRWFGIELVVADTSLASRHLKASFAGEPARQVLDVIALALGAQLERRGDTAILRERKPAPHTP